MNKYNRISFLVNTFYDERIKYFCNIGLMEETMDIIEALEWRYAVKKFDSNKKISTEQLERVLKSLQLTPG